jgi:hypothetical protein
VVAEGYWVGIKKIFEMRAEKPASVTPITASKPSAPPPNTETHGTTDTVDAKPKRHGTADKAMVEVKHPPAPVKSPTAEEIADALAKNLTLSRLPYSDKSPQELKQTTLQFVAKLNDMYQSYNKELTEIQIGAQKQAEAAQTPEEKHRIYDSLLGPGGLAARRGTSLAMAYRDCCERDAIELREALIQKIGPGARSEINSSMYTVPDNLLFARPTVTRDVAYDLERLAKMIQ